MHACMHSQLLTHVWPFATPWTVAHWAPLPMGFFRQEYWSGLPSSSPRYLPHPGIEPMFPVLQVVPCTGGRFFTYWATGTVLYFCARMKSKHIISAVLFWYNFFVSCVRGLQNEKFCRALLKTERPVSVKCQHVQGTDTLMLNYMFYKRKEWFEIKCFPSKENKELMVNQQFL